MEHMISLMSQEREANSKAGNHVQFHPRPPSHLPGPLLEHVQGAADCRPTCAAEGLSRLPQDTFGTSIDMM